MTKTTLNKSVVTELKKHRGLEEHRGKIRITFHYRGVRCRETLPLELTVPNVRAAADQRAVINREIKLGTFDYRVHFPTSKKAELWGMPSSEKRTMAKGIELWLAAKKATKAPSTYRNYESKALIHVEPKWGERTIDSINKAELEAWRANLIEDGYNVKTVNDIFTVVRGVFRDAFDDSVIDRNVTEKIHNYDTTGNNSAADPFTREEIDRIANTPTKRQSELNMVMFAIWTGLSVSELIAMAWEDVDFDNMTLHVRRGRVDREFKAPKERQRDRVIELIPAAQDWLLAQRALSQLLPPVEIEVLQRDNVSLVKETIRPVWVNSKSQTYHASDWAISKRFLEAHLRKANVRYRPINQTRHTFASQMLSAYVNEQWIVKQLGHGSTSMLHRHYGKFMPNEAPKMGDRIMRQLERARADNE